MSEQFPYSFGKYRMEAEIGRGGFGTVFRALDTNLDRLVAIKILDPIYMRDRRWVTRFRQEARVMARLDHPHIVPIYDTGEQDGRLFLAMKFVDGPNLGQISDKTGLPWARVVELVQQISAALDYAHASDVIHRDLKPGNILISDQKAMLTDFGLAKIVDDNSQSISVSGGIAGTYNYMAPEVFNNEEVTPASDIYALGCLLFEMLVGHKLFEGQSTAAIIGAHLKGISIDEPLPEGTPAGTLELLQTALAKDPANRFHSAGELSEEMTRLSQDRLAEPYAALEQAMAGQRWQEAINLVTGIRAQDPNYRDSAALEERALAENEAAQRRHWAAEWRSSAEQALAAGSFDEVRGALNQWRRVAPDDTQIPIVEKNLILAEKYVALQQLITAENWAAAQSAAAEIYAQDPSFRGIAGLQSTIKAHLQPPPPDPQPHPQPPVPVKRNRTLIIAGAIAGISICLLLVLFYFSGDVIEGLFQSVVGSIETTVESPTLVEEAPPEEPAHPDGYLDRAYAGEFSGSEVLIMGNISEEEVLLFNDSMADFEQQTGIDIRYARENDFEPKLKTFIESGSAPDIGDMPQPGTMGYLAGLGYVVDVSQYIPMDELSERYNDSWLDMSLAESPNGTIVGGVWHRFGPKSLVFYRPQMFERYGYDVPETWDELLRLTEKMAEDGHTPWCIGIESGWATGWVATDWTEELLLRTAPLESYDAWTAGDLPFYSDEVITAVKLWSDIWFNPNYVYGGTESIVDTYFIDAALPLFDDPPGCFLHKQGSFMVNFFPEDAQYGTGYDFFYFPGVDAQYGRPLLVGGNIMTQFNDRDEVRAVMEFFTTPESLNAWVRNGGAYSPHLQATSEMYGTLMGQTIAQLIEETQIFRFDASDIMPSQVGSGQFWESMTEYVSGTTDLESALKEIDAAWPR